MPRKPVTKKKELAIADQLEEVSRMTNSELEYIINEDDTRPGIIKQFASAILDGEIGDTLKIVKEVSKMRAPDDNKDKSIEDLAIGEDDEAFYIALIKQNVSQLTKSNASPQEVARLSQNTNIFRKELREIRSRKPKAGSTLERVLAAANGPRKPVTKVKSPKKRKTTSPKALGATKIKKTGVVSSKGRK